MYEYDDIYIQIDVQIIAKCDIFFFVFKSITN